jgi:hypothetical protein
MTAHGAHPPQTPPQPAQHPSASKWDKIHDRVVNIARKVFIGGAVITMVTGGIATYEAIHREEIALELALDSHNPNAVNTARGELDNDRTVLLAEEAGAVALMACGYVGSRLKDKKLATIASISLVAGSFVVASLAGTETQAAVSADVAAIHQDIQTSNAQAAVNARGGLDRDLVMRDIATPAAYAMFIGAATTGLTEMADVAYYAINP